MAKLWEGYRAQYRQQAKDFVERARAGEDPQQLAQELAAALEEARKHGTFEGYTDASDDY